MVGLNAITSPLKSREALVNASDSRLRKLKSMAFSAVNTFFACSFV